MTQPARSHIATGKSGEEIGVLYLKNKGYRILETNYKTPIGEIDCVARSKGFIVFVETKTRQQSRFGFPEESVTRNKQRKIIQVAKWYLKEKRLLDHPVRFDVLSIIAGEEIVPECHLIQDAFEVNEG